MKKPISSRVKRVDSDEKVRGEALYLADELPENPLYLRTFRSPVSRGKLRGIRFPGIPPGCHSFTAEDIPGTNGVQLIDDSWPVLASGEVRYKGQPLALLCGPDRDVLDDLIRRTEAEIEEEKGVFSLDEALKEPDTGGVTGSGSVYEDRTLIKGNPGRAFSRAARVVEDVLETGYQEQVYMEPQGMAAWMEGDRIVLKGSMQCPYYVHKAVVHLLGWSEDRVDVKQAVTGGAFGGKEDYPEILASRVALAASLTGRPVVEIMDREEDMAVTCKRHPARMRYRTALDENDRITAVEADILLNAGAYLTYSYVVLQRAMFTSLGVYNIPNARVRGRAAATNMVPSGAFRGFGAPQGTFGIEVHMHHLALALKRDPMRFKCRHFIRRGDATVTNGIMRDEVKLPQMAERLAGLTDYHARREEETAASGRLGKEGAEERRTPEGRLKGIGFSFFNHGCGFTGDGEAAIIKAVVRVRRSPGGTVRVLTSNVEMGQGLTTTFRKIAAGALDLPLDRVRYDNPDTDEVPNSGPTAASRSCMVVGYLVQQAAERLKERWDEPGEIEEEAHFEQPPWVQWNQETLQGDAYPSYGWGANAVEVEVDPVTYEVFIRKAWGIFDVGVAIDEQIVQGQIEGGMVQAFGYGGLEKMEIGDGTFRQKTMADYPIPTVLDVPPIRSELVENPYELGPSGAKGAGELTFDGGAAALAAAVQNAVGRPVTRIPVTPEGLMEIMEDDPERDAGQGGKR